MVKEDFSETVSYRTIVDTVKDVEQRYPTVSFAFILVYVGHHFFDGLQRFL